MKTRFAKKIWCRRIDRLSPYWYHKVWNYCAKINRDHRIAKTKQIHLKQYGKKKQVQHRGGEMGAR